MDVKIVPEAGGPDGRNRERARAGYALFVAQGTYRQRRMKDAAGLLPVLGGILFAMPLLWMGSGEGGGPGVRTSQVMIYLFAVWGGLAILSALVTRSLRTDQGADEDEEDTSAEAFSKPDVPIDPPPDGTRPDGAAQGG